jgi:hypothetical protein
MTSKNLLCCMDGETFMKKSNKTSSEKLKDILLINEISLGEFVAEDELKNKYRCRAYIKRDGYIPDVYINFTPMVAEARVDNVWDDAVFTQYAMNFLNSLGYQGPDFGRAESGMQEPNLVVLEPNKAFYPFAKKCGYKLLKD